MNQSIIHVALVVRDYDEAIDFYCNKLHFKLVEDTYQPEQDKRWVVVAPPGSNGTNLLLARASTPDQAAFIGCQTGGRVFLFLSTDDFWRDYTEMHSAGINFVRPPVEAPYGTVAVFEDLYGNLWDLIEPRKQKVGQETIHIDEFLGKEVDIDFMFFTTEFIASCLKDSGFEGIDIIERDPYPGVEYQSRRAYGFVRK